MLPLTSCVSVPVAVCAPEGFLPGSKQGPAGCAGELAARSGSGQPGSSAWGHLMLPAGTVPALPWDKHRAAGEQGKWLEGNASAGILSNSLLLLPFFSSRLYTA